VGKLFLAFTLVPLLDLWLLLRIGGRLGLAPTVALVLGTGLLGAWLARREGARVLQGWRRAAAEGRLPEEGVLSGALVLAGGVLLVTPGVLTDVAGIALLLPPTRRLAAGALRGWLLRKVERGQVRVTTFGGPPWPGGGPPAAPPKEIDVTPRRPER
jgi:UPF0716 protein FxsA